MSITKNSLVDEIANVNFL